MKKISSLLIAAFLLLIVTVNAQTTADSTHTSAPKSSHVSIPDSSNASPTHSSHGTGTDSTHSSSTHPPHGSVADSSHASVPHAAPAAHAAPAPVKITTAEGITEYKLGNGLRVLLFPDAGKATTTVNVTYL